jgi:hypothetical protein
MSDNQFQALRTNRVWVITNNATHELVGDPFNTQEGAEAEAGRLNLKAWRADRPQTAVSEPMEWESTDPADRLMEILDKPPAELMYAEAA